MVIYPEYISLRNFADALFINYPNEQLPILENEKDWVEWASVLSGTGIFLRNNVPTPVSLKEGKKEIYFDTWQDWAKALYITMINVD